MKLAMFIPLAKADAAQRLVYGFIDETPDRANEVMDYATAKPAFQTWSEDMNKASGGKSFGNVRAQHDMKKAAGKLSEAISFDDDAKRIGFVAHIVDDQEWQKVKSGVYTGFSPGGRYAKRWKDGAHHRYTPEVGELSIVDVPCIPSASFTMLKADGTEEEVEFVLGKAYEPGNDATKDRAEEMAKAADGTSWKDHVAQARADLIAENAVEALAKMAAGDDAEPVVEAEPDRLAALDAALAKADQALAEPEADGPAPEVYAKALAEMADRFGDNPLLAKGLRGIMSLSAAIYQVVAVQASMAREAADEGDASPVPAQVTEGIRTLCAALVASAQEETAELLADLDEVGFEEEVTDWSDYECAAQIVDLVKADSAIMEKAGARNAKPDAARIQTIHDKACELGAGCSDGGAAEKAANLAAENDRLLKGIETAAPAIDKLTERLEALAGERDEDRAAMAKMAAQIEELGGQPAPTKLDMVISHTKEEDGLAKVEPEAPEGSMDSIRAMPPGPDRARAMEKYAFDLQHKTPA